MDQDAEKTFDLISKALEKMAQIIIQGRIPFEPSQFTKTNVWYHLETRDADEISQRLQHWKKQVFLPLNVLIYVVEGRGSESEKRVLLEHWRIRFHPEDAGSAMVDKNAWVKEPATVHKRLIVMMRTLFCHSRIMPGYALYKARIKNKNANYYLDYRCGFETESYSDEFDQPPKHFNLGEVQTKSGSLRCAVSYRTKYIVKSPPALIGDNVVEDYYASPQQTPPYGVPIVSSAPAKQGFMDSAAANVGRTNPRSRAQTVSAADAPRQIGGSYASQPIGVAERPRQVTEAPVDPRYQATTAPSVNRDHFGGFGSSGSPGGVAIPGGYAQRAQPIPSQRVRAKTVGAADQYNPSPDSQSGSPSSRGFSPNPITSAMSPPVPSLMKAINPQYASPSPETYMTRAQPGSSYGAAPNPFRDHSNVGSSDPNTSGFGGSPADISFGRSPPSAIFQPFKALKRSVSTEKSMVSPFRDGPRSGSGGTHPGSSPPDASAGGIPGTTPSQHPQYPPFRGPSYPSSLPSESDSYMSRGASSTDTPPTEGEKFRSTRGTPLMRNLNHSRQSSSDMPPIRDEDDDDDDNDDNSMPFQIDDDHDFVPLPQEKSKPIMFGDDDEATSELKTFMSDLSKFDKKVGYTPDLLEDAALEVVANDLKTWSPLRTNLSE